VVRKQPLVGKLNGEAHAHRVGSPISRPGDNHMIRTARTVLLLAAVTIPLLFTAACTPEQIAAYQQATPAEQAAIIEALQTPPAHTPPSGFLACVRRHESGGNYQAKNPVSTASGAYQFLDGTWATMSARAGHSGYGSARHAPPAVQDAVATYTVNAGWKSAWNGTGC